MVNGKAKKIEVKAAPVVESEAFKNEPTEEAAPAAPTSATPELDAAVQQIAVDNPDVKETETAPVVEETPAAPEPVVEEAAPVAEETPAPAAPVVEEAAPAAVEADDLKKIEGIGPKIAEHLNGGGILTFAQLSETAPEKIKEILAAAGPRYAMHDPTTWPSQAKMAAAGQWDELKKWQDESDGGKPIEPKEGE